MAYIQILTFVLCSYLLQDGVSALPDRWAESISSNDLDDSQQLMDAIEQIVPIATPDGSVSKEMTEALEPFPSPSEKEYPKLAAVKDMFWNTLENINVASESGKLDIRALRNMMSNVLSDRLFWSTLVGVIAKRAIVNNDEIRANRKIQKCQMFTAAITSPIAVQGFENIASETYNAVSNIRSDLGANALQVITEMVDSGEVTRSLDTITDVLNKIECDSQKLIKGFNTVHRMINMGGGMRGGLAKGIMAFSSNFK